MSERSTKPRGRQGLHARKLTEAVVAPVLGLALGVVPATAADAGSAADLSPTRITADLPVVVGETVHFDSGIRNRGDGGTGAFNIKWLVDGQEVGAYGSHEGLRGHSTKRTGNSQFDWTFYDRGRHVVTFIVDVDNHVRESDEWNNARSFTVRVRGGYN
jgi:subtilase family serine protease